MRTSGWRTGAVVALAAVVALGGGASASGQRVGGAEEDDGALIRIGPDRGAERAERGRLRRPGFREAPRVVSRYWIGVAGEPTPPEVLAHIDTDDRPGVMIRTVRPDSPAAEGGLLPYDVVTEVNGETLADMRQLAEAVGEAGEKRGRLTLQLVRGGRPQTLWVTPAERPAPVDAPRAGGWPGDPAGGRPFGFGALPGGVSIGVTQSGDEPAKITVRRGDEAWELDANDADAIAALPDDVRPLVERAVGGGMRAEPPRGAFGDRDPWGRFGLGFGDRVPGLAPEDLRQRMREMEQQVEELRRRFGVPEPAGEPQPDDVPIPAES